MNEEIEEQVADQAKALQDAAAKRKLTVTADACLIAASHLMQIRQAKDIMEHLPEILAKVTTEPPKAKK